MERHDECDCWCWYGQIHCIPRDEELTVYQGPAHAVYFGTYEVVKDLAGGNKQDGKHHPLAAGMNFAQPHEDKLT